MGTIEPAWQHTGEVWIPFRRKRGLVREAALAGAPVKPRVKTYSAETGYVYQYVYRGQRAVPVATEYVFSATRDRKSWLPVFILFPEQVIDEWEAVVRRKLTGTERYAVVKLTLLEFFDRAESFEMPAGPLTVDGATVSRHLDALGRL